MREGVHIRLWVNAKGGLMTDEQVLAHIASHGSLCATLEAGDMVLLAGESEPAVPRGPVAKGKGGKRHAKLAECL